MLEQVSIDALIPMHLDTLVARGFSPRTVQARASHLRSAARWLDAHSLRTAHAVERRHLEAYGAFLATAAITGAAGHARDPATCRNHLTALRMFFRGLHRDGLVAADPTEGLALPTPSRALPRTILAPQEIDAIRKQALSACRNRVRDRAIVETLYATGIRRAECTALTVADVDSQRQTLAIRHGKGRRQRIVPIAVCALGWIAAYLRREQRLERRAITPQSPLFAGPAGRALTPSQLSDRIKDLMGRAGVQKPGACHAFRHAMATHMLDNGADIRFIQAMLGHADISTTMLYTHVSIRGLAEVYRRTHPSARGS